MKLYSSTTKNHNLPGRGHKNMEHLLNKYERDEMDYTRSTDNKRHVGYEDLQNSLHNQIHHASLIPLSPLPPSPPSLTSSHSSSEVFSSESLTSFDELPSCSMVNTVGETMELSSSQKETKESLEEQDSRGGGLTCPDETSEWRSLNKAGIGDC